MSHIYITYNHIASHTLTLLPSLKKICPRFKADAIGEKVQLIVYAVVRSSMGALLGCPSQSRPRPWRRRSSVSRLGSGGSTSSGVVPFIATLQAYDCFLLSFCRTLSCILAWCSRMSVWGSGLCSFQFVKAIHYL